MSLKSFHILFITLSTGLCVGMASWGLVMFTSPMGSGAHLAITAVALAAVPVLALYVKYFARKARQLGLE